MAVVRIGIDIGQKVDPTALAVLEVEPRNGPTGWEDHYLARHLERLPLGTPYPAVAERLREVVAGVRTHILDPQRRPVGDPPPRLDLVVYADATGVGQPVVDLLRAAGEAVTACYFTHGDRRTEEHGQVSIGKAWLVSRLKTLFQTGRLHLPRTPEAAALERELLDYEIRIGEDANDRYGAFRVGAHDDLVTAIGLAAQGQETAPVIVGSWLPRAGRDAYRGPPRPGGGWPA